MKIVLPIICSLFFIGCGDNKPTEVSATAQTIAPIEVKSSSPETNTTAVVAPLTPAMNSVDGAALFAQKCVSCHGAKAEKSALNKSQVIATFGEQQIKDALKGYQNGTYGKDMKAVMQGQAKGLNDAQIDALAKYISTL